MMRDIRSRRREILFLALILLPGVFFRVFHLGSIFLNEDEPFHQVRLSLQSLPFVLAHNNGPFFSILVHFLLPLGRLEIMARIVSAACGILSIGLIFVVGKALFSKAEGLIAAVFVSFSHLLIFYSQQSRSYALLAALSLGSFFFFFRAVRDNRPLDWGLYGLTTCLNIYTHVVALLILPSLGLYLAYLWLEKRRKRQGATDGRPRKKVIARFVLSTVTAGLVAFVLYLPSAWIRDFLEGSLRRSIARPSDAVRVSLSQIHEILRFQISAGGSLLYILVLGLAIAGFIASIKRKRPEAMLCLLYFAVPWIIFLAGETRENTLHSLYRYLIFLLPPIYLLAAKGITALTALLNSAFFHGRPTHPAFLSRLVLVMVVGAIAASSFGSIRWYYVDYWRQGSYAFDRATRAFLSEHAKRDAMIYVDDFPASSATIMLDPLAKDLKPEEIEFVAREDYQAPPGSGVAMIYRLGWSYFEGNVASHKLELWAVTPATDDKLRFLREPGTTAPGMEVFDLGRSILLFLRKDEESLAQKMGRLADVLLVMPEKDPVIRRQRCLLAAKAFFMTREAEDGIRAVDSFRAIPMSPSRPARTREAWPDRALGALFGLDSNKLEAIYEQRSLAEIQHVAFLHANNLLSAGRLDGAHRAYSAVLGLGRDYDSRILDKFGVLFERLEEAGLLREAREVCREALERDPYRKDFSARLAEVEKMLEDENKRKKVGEVSPS